MRRTKLIQMKLDLEEKEMMPTNAIPGFRERLESMLPTLIEHRCSVGERAVSFNGWKKVPGWGMS